MKKIDLEQIPAREIVPGYSVKLVHSEFMSVAYWDIKAGALMPEHSHLHEQIANLIEGEFELTVAGETQVLKPGSIVIIPPDVRHSGKALKDTRMIDVFYPTRKI